VNNPSISERGLSVLKKLEGLRLIAYLDGGGLPTIGYGHTKDVVIGQIITEGEADRFLRDDVYTAEAVVRRSMDCDLINRDQFDALVCFVFNVGGARFLGSTMLRHLRAGDCQSAAAEFGRWVFIGKQKSAGLVRRRATERALFLGELPWTSTPAV
jgi:lysozyme